MDWTHIGDWDDAYDNRKRLTDFEGLAAGLAEAGAAYRARMEAAGRARLDVAYGPAPRQRYDLFLPEGTPCGLAFYIHGGYWRSFSKSDWSHLAEGARAQGWAVALPGYTLCPEATVPEITVEIAEAVEAAAREIEGPIRLAGHSAGGHLAARMVSADSRLRPETLDRIAHLLAISPVSDLRPLLENEWNHVYRLNERTARAESPVLIEPVQNLRMTVWVGGDELPEFQRHAALLANIWVGGGAATRLVTNPGHDHFTVVEALARADSPLARAWVSD